VDVILGVLGDIEVDDEVDIRDIEVLYGRSRGRGGDRWGQNEITHEGGCIGGSECGGRRARIRIDDEILEYSLDIPREGRTFTIDGKGIDGDYLYIEPAEDDEVVVRDIRVRFGNSY
jgi:hypothetical protein